MAKYLLRAMSTIAWNRRAASRNPFIRFQIALRALLREAAQLVLTALLALCLENRGVFCSAFVAFCVGSVALLYPWLGQDFFPSVDAGQFKLHVRAHTGTRIEDTARLCDQIEDVIRSEIPKSELGTIIDNIGLPYSGHQSLLHRTRRRSAPATRTSWSRCRSTIGRPRSTATICATKLAAISRHTFYYLPTDIVSQILNFGLPAPIDVQVAGQQLARTALSPSS